MAASAHRFSLNLLGSFRLVGPDGERIDIASRKGMAMVAMLATADGGERTRGWLQEKLWGQRDRPQAQGSLRRELSHLREHLNTGDKPALICERQRVQLDLPQFDIDVLAPRHNGGAAGDFLEGFDLAGEEGFEDWLREQRSVLAARATAKTVDRLSAEKQPSAETPAAGFVDRPALAILPFANLTGDAANDYLCEGVSEDLIDRVSRLRWLPVIARNSSFAFASDRLDPRIIGQKLSAKYVLEGRLKPASDGLSLAVSLSDAVTGYSMWSHRVPLPFHGTQDALDPIVAELVGVLDTQVDYAEQMRARGNRQNRLEFNDLIWRGRWHLNRLTRADSEMARRLFDQALELEPDSPEAMIQATFCFGWSLWARRGSDAEIGEMRRLAHRAIVADPDDGRGHMLAGMAELWLRQTARARTLFEHAIALNPSLFANIASSFGVSDEARALYPFLTHPQGSSDGQIAAFIDSVYNNLFNRGSDAAGLAYWTDQVKATLAAGQFVGSVLINIMSGTQDTSAGKDITTLMGKVAVSLAYVHEQQAHHTTWLGASDTAAATNLLHGVTSDPATVLAGIKNAEVLIAAHP